jgi:hypothetical protein
MTYTGWTLNILVWFQPKSSFLGAFAKMPKAIIIFIMSVRRIGQLGSHLRDFQEI